MVESKVTIPEKKILEEARRLRKEYEDKRITKRVKWYAMAIINYFRVFKRLKELEEDISSLLDIQKAETQNFELIIQLLNGKDSKAEPTDPTLEYHIKELEEEIREYEKLLKN